MKNLFMKAWIVLCIGMLSVLSFAQDDTLTTFEFEDSGASISFPEDWEHEVGDNGELELTMGDSMVIVYDTVAITNEFEIDQAETPEELLELIQEKLSTDDAETVKLVELDGREIAKMAMSVDEGIGAVAAVPMDDETVGLVMFTISSSDEEDDLTEIIDEMIASFNVGDSTATGEACSVSTDQSNTVQIRVGPGQNRTVIAFLPAGISFNVLGQTTDGDGNMWFSMPKDEVAPTKAVNETWIASDSVDQSGDCATVVDALAPPIIPIRQAQPTPVPQVADDGTVTEPVADTTDAESGDAFATDADGALIPTQGLWVERHYNGTGTCEDGRTGTTNPRVGDFTADLSGGGVNGITFNDTFYSYIGNDTYEAYEVVPYSGGEYVARLTFTLTSANTAGGSIGEVYNKCNFNLPITLNYIGG
jgi:hypothetical protein